ncbi:MAG: hypothetical protein EOO77_17295 [Oxalobacteraceae bacterium]|nr:MAG: hypothetical protein EOO77_17295 [Oxalobacteraceae bacterium]
MKAYQFQCIRIDGPGPAVHFDTCSDDRGALDRARALFDIWPLAVKVDVLQGDRKFEVLRSEPEGL